MTSERNFWKATPPGKRRACEVTRRIYVSLPADKWLPSRQNELKWGIVQKIKDIHYRPEIFTNPKGDDGLASARSWHPRDADEIARRCVGAVVIGMARWRFRDGKGNPVALATEFNHYEGGLVHTLGLPTLVLAQTNILHRCVLDMNYGGYLGEFTPKAGPDWLDTHEFLTPFGYWQRRLEERRDVFLGYASASTKIAKQIKEHLEKNGASVLDWQTDLLPGHTILEQIEAAAARSLGGIFLFTKDDELADRKKKYTAVPRDNVVFEAGYFIGLKGKHNVLIIRESGSKMPADLGGDIYASLPGRRSIEPIKRTLESFMQAL